MTQSSAIRIGSIELKNPVICSSGEHVMSETGIQRALQAGVSAVVVKSTNESAAAKAQIKKADYLALDSDWQAITDESPIPREATFLCRSGLTPQPFDEWLAMVAEMDQKAAARNAYVVASLVVSDLDAAVAMSTEIQQAGVRVLEVNIGTPYADEAEQNCVSTVRSPARVTEIVRAVRNEVSIPLWVKLTGQSEQVDSLVLAAKSGGADSVVFPGRFLGLVPDIETQEPFLGSNVGIGGYWNLPLSCYWIARAHRILARETSASDVDGDAESRERSNTPEFPLIGTNGARSGLDVVRFLLAGASAVEMASVVLTRGFDALSDAVDELEQYLERHSCSATELIGKAAGAKSFQEMPDRDEPWQTLLPNSS
jgi:dihydroorotate dehydrogenase (NAD+) catalytic subunit